MAQIYMILDGISSREVGLCCKTHRPVLPPLTPSLEAISGVDGSYDYGNNVYEDRTIDVDFYTYAPTFEAFRYSIRDIAKWLSRKGRIVFTDEPDKYYIGRVYVSPMLDQSVISAGRFTASFLCEPFAYGAADSFGKTDNLTMELPVDYKGTHSACCKIIIRNTGTTPIINPKITHFMKTD